MSRWLISLLAVAAVAGTVSCSTMRNYEDASYSFVILGDNRPWGSSENITQQNEHFYRNIERVNKSGGDFAVIVGDLIYGYTKDVDLINAEWDGYEEALEKFEVPVHSVPGNHDIWDETSRKIWRRRFGKTDFSWRHKGSYFIALNSELGDQHAIDAHQLKWLRKQLKRARRREAQHIFVFLHKPLWNWKLKEGETVNRWHREVHPLLAEYGVDYVFAGHEHRYCLYPERDGVKYVITGGGGAELRETVLQGGFYHILVMDVDAGEASYRIVSDLGDVPLDIVTQEKVEALPGDLSIMPVHSMGDDGRVDLAFQLSNPADRDLTAILRWSTEGTSWQTADAAGPIGARQSQGLSTTVYVGGDLYPLPRAEVTLEADDHTFHKAGLIINQAFASFLAQVPAWNIIAPFGTEIENLGRQITYEEFETMPIKGWTDPLPAETPIDLAGTYAVKDGSQAGWTTVPTTGPEGYVDLEAIYHSDYATALAVSYVHVDEAGKYQLLIGSDDGIVVSVNGQEVMRKRVLRGVTPDEDAATVEFKQGWNEIRLKVLEFGGGWGFACRFVDPHRKLKFALKPEDGE